MGAQVQAVEAAGVALFHAVDGGQHIVLQLPRFRTGAHLVTIDALQLQRREILERQHRDAAHQRERHADVQQALAHHVTRLGREGQRQNLLRRQLARDRLADAQRQGSGLGRAGIGIDQHDLALGQLDGSLFFGRHQAVRSEAGQIRFVHRAHYTG